jgi:hypothetical protein
MRVNNKVAAVGNHEATSRSRNLAEVGPIRVHGEHQPTPNRSRASAGRPSQGGASGGGDRGGRRGRSSHGTDRRADGGGERGGRGHANSHATGNAHGGYDTHHRIDEICRAKKTTEVSDSDGFPAYSSQLRALLLLQKFKPLGITKYDAKQDPVQ